MHTPTFRTPITSEPPYFKTPIIQEVPLSYQSAIFTSEAPIRPDIPQHVRVHRIKVPSIHQWHPIIRVPPPKHQRPSITRVLLSHQSPSYTSEAPHYIKTSEVTHYQRPPHHIKVPPIHKKPPITSNFPYTLDEPFRQSLPIT